MFQRLLDIFFPRKCAFCGVFLKRGTEGYICRDCIVNSHPNRNRCSKCNGLISVTKTPSFCPVCTGLKRHYNGALSSYRYFEEPFNSAVKRLKSARRPTLAKALTYELLRSFEILNINGDSFDYITFIPSHKKREQEKNGHNPAKLLAECIASALKIPVIPVLIKHKETKLQSSLSKSERTANIRGSFKINTKYDIQGKNILLIDDVFTTGSTMEEAARILKKGGASFVFGATVACTGRN